MFKVKDQSYTLCIDCFDSLKKMKINNVSSNPEKALLHKFKASFTAINKQLDTFAHDDSKMMLYAARIYLYLLDGGMTQLSLLPSSLSPTKKHKNRYNYRNNDDDVTNDTNNKFDGMYKDYKTSKERDLLNWQDLPTVLLCETCQYLCNNISDLHVMNTVCSEWDFGLKAAMKNNQYLYSEKLLKRAVYGVYLDNNSYCNWIGYQCKMHFSKHSFVQKSYSVFNDNIECLYLDVFNIEKSKANDANDRNDDANDDSANNDDQTNDNNSSSSNSSESDFFKLIAQYFTEQLCLWISSAKNNSTNYDYCVASFGEFKKNDYFQNIMNVLSYCCEHQLLIFCAFLLSILDKQCRKLKWNRKCALHMEDCIIAGFGVNKLKNNNILFAKHVSKFCDKLSQ